MATETTQLTPRQEYYRQRYEQNKARLKAKYRETHPLKEKPALVPLAQGEKKTGPWSEEEWQYLRDNYLKKTVAEMANHLKRGASTTGHEMRSLGLRKNHPRGSAEERKQAAHEQRRQREGWQTRKTPAPEKMPVMVMREKEEPKQPMKRWPAVYSNKGCYWEFELQYAS